MELSEAAHVQISDMHLRDMRLPPSHLQVLGGDEEPGAGPAGCSGGGGRGAGARAAAGHGGAARARSGRERGAAYQL